MFGKDGVFSAIRYAFIPAIISALRGEFWDDQGVELMLFLWVALSVLLVLSEYAFIKKYFPSYSFFFRFNRIRMNPYKKTGPFALMVSGQRIGLFQRVVRYDVQIKYQNFDLVSRSKTLDGIFDKEEIILHLGRKMLLETIGPKCRIRLLGLSVSNLVWEGDEKRQQQMLDFFNETELAVGNEEE